MKRCVLLVSRFVNSQERLKGAVGKNWASDFVSRHEGNLCSPVLCNIGSNFIKQSTYLYSDYYDLVDIQMLRATNIY